jgi:heat shock protein HslJ
MRRTIALLLTVAIALVACDLGADSPPAPVDGHPATLAGTSWVVSAIGGVATPRDSMPTLTFDGSTVRGSGGCNSLGGSYRYQPATGELQFHDIGMTAMACAEPARNQVETAFTTAIGEPFLVATLQPDGHLVLASQGGARLDLDVVGPTVTD